MQGKTRPGSQHLRYNTSNGPDGGGGAGGGYGGGGGGVSGGGSMRSQPPQQQDKPPPPQTSILHQQHPGTNHLIGTYQRPNSQAPGTAIGPSYHVHYTAVRPTSRQHQVTTVPRQGALLPFFDGATMSQLSMPFYAGPGMQIPLLYQGGGSADNSRGPQPPGHYSWTSPGAQPPPPVAIMTQPPPPSQSSQQQQPQPQPQHFSPGQYTYLSRLTPNYGNSNAGGGGSGGGVQPSAQVLVDQRAIPPPQLCQMPGPTVPQSQVVQQAPGSGGVSGQSVVALAAAKAKSTRKNRIPIINPETMEEVQLGDSGSGAAAPGGDSAFGTAAATGQPHNPSHPSPAGIMHPQQPPQMGGNNNPVLAAEFAKQVLLVAMNEGPTSTAPASLVEPDEPQVNGPGGMVPSAVSVEEVTPVSAPPVIPQMAPVLAKRPAGPTPVVSAKGGTAYDLPPIRNTSSRVEMRSAEGSPGRGKVSASPVRDHREASPSHTTPAPAHQSPAPPPQTTLPEAPPQHHPVPTYQRVASPPAQAVPHQPAPPQPQPQPQEVVPKQQRRPREESKKPVQPQPQPQTQPQPPTQRAATVRRRPRG